MKEYHAGSSKVAKCICNTVLTLKKLGTSKTKFDIISCIYSLYSTLITDNCEQTKNISLTSQNNRNIVKLKKVLSYIRTSFSEPISLSDMAAICNMTPKYFCTFFKKMTKKSPVEYLTSYRIEKACRMLQSSDLSVTDIAFSCGFGDLSYFIKTFKKHTGQSPGKYCGQ
jgi:AraC-like DNA-binding protein